MPTQPHHPVKPSPMRNLSEYAVADTPGTAGPEFVGAGDYLQARFAPISPLAVAGGAHTDPHGTGHQTHQGGSAPDPKERGMPTALERGVRGGSGPVNDAERWGTRYVNPGEVPRGTKQNENVEAEAQMEMYPEGKVADAVERKRGMQTQTQTHRARRGSVNVSAAAVRGRSPPGGLHGRGRGEVTLEAGEADLERKKQQQAAARKQVMDARKRGEDVDGRGTTGPSGRQPRAEID
ncbi:hypothetical protein C8A01DRAFT_31952 [Parachaetomium inaequale]|uniref:Uncharacterized protein n=1 Tax=Parachaetomium inaequale TaxID=2588326 RepID=A0AAN6SV86_9PEZI|nr:hypothetical protein C8A01DRAFT_31952 [Parachaetomium inaequale]